MKSEYKSCLAQLDPENKKLLRKIKLYVDSRHLSRVAKEDLMGDIAGMALESQKRGESFSESIGDHEIFCRELVKNSPRATVAEEIFRILTFVFLFAALLAPFIYALDAVFDLSGITTAGAVLSVPNAMLLKYLCVVSIAVAGWFLAFRQLYRSIVAVCVTYAVTIIVGFAVFDVFTGLIPDAPVWEINLIWWFLCFGALFALSLTANRLTAITVAYQQQKKLRKLNK